MVATLLSLVATLIPTQAGADSTGQLIELVDAAAARLQIADPVAAFKWSAQLAIEDPEREQHELAALGDAASAQQIDPDYVIRVFRDQINATVAIEYSRFADWKLNPAGVPAAPPDLSASRSAIDALNKEILSQTTRNWSLLHTSACAAQLDSAKSAAARARRFDNLYQRALSTATQSYCQAPLPA